MKYQFGCCAAGDATIYSTGICSGTARWEDADLSVSRFGAWHAPRGALVMPRHCGALGAVFAEGRILEAGSDPGVTGPL